jgi:disulfide bond formation protein DsbB
MTMAVPDPTLHSAYRSGALALFLAAGTILAALAFEHLGGYPPCPLCLEERYAYYAGVPVLFLALVLLSATQLRGAALLFFLVGLAFLANTAVGVYHAGAEWHFWPGPASCTGAQDLAKSAGSLLNALSTTRVVRCDEAALRILGVSLAGWNAVVSLVIAAMSLRATVESARAQ